MRHRSRQDSQQSSKDTAVIEAFNVGDMDDGDTALHALMMLLRFGRPMPHCWLEQESSRP